MRVQRDIVIPTGDGVPLLANGFYPADFDQAPLVLLRSPYGRGVGLDRMPQLLVERGYQVLPSDRRCPRCRRSNPGAAGLLSSGYARLTL